MNKQISAGLALKCPYIECPSFTASAAVADPSPKTDTTVRNSDGFKRKGYYFRTSDSRRVPVFVCLRCKRSFSSSRLTACFRQKKRAINHQVMKLLASGVSQRRTARLLGINRKTLVRKFLFWAQQASLFHQEFMESITQGESKIKAAQFDEMETFEKSKCLPLSVPLVVETKSRKILGFRVCEMPSKGMLVEKSLKKYGPRQDGRPAAAASLFVEIAKVLDPQAEITSDQNPKYPNWIKKSLPKTISHKTIKGSRGCIVGQGELKKTGFDPLFSFNHTAAMLRANINRLFRRTWCTTKRKDRLAAHIAIYVYYHNTVLTEFPST